MRTFSPRLFGLGLALGALAAALVLAAGAYGRTAAEGPASAGRRADARGGRASGREGSGHALDLLRSTDSAVRLQGCP
jgi:hypothetical protein